MTLAAVIWHWREQFNRWFPPGGASGRHRSDEGRFAVVFAPALALIGLVWLLNAVLR